MKFPLSAPVRSLFRALSRNLTAVFHVAGRIIRALSPTWKTVVGVSLVAFFVTSTLLIAEADERYSVTVPDNKGNITEGVVGAPKIINPVLDTAGTTGDLTTLIFSGLMGRKPEGGYEPILAQSVEMAAEHEHEEGGTDTATTTENVMYRFTLREGLTFHDGSPVTSEDVAFTYGLIANAAIKSPLAGELAGVTVTTIDDRTIDMSIPINIKEPYSVASVGILSKDMYAAIPEADFGLSEYHSAPIGAGPFSLERIDRDTNNIPVSITLERNESYALGSPKIKNINFRFFKNETDAVSAFRNGEIDSIGGISPEFANIIAESATAENIHHMDLPRLFGVFFNTTKNPALGDPQVREALRIVAPQQSIIDTVFNGYATAVSSPIPRYIGSRVAFDVNTGKLTASSTDERKLAAEAILDKAGYKLGENGLRAKAGNQSVPLSITLTTANTPDLASAANIIKSAWEDIGASVDIRLFDPGDLNQNYIRKRDYEALLFGQRISTDTDLYAFWHSSRRNDPGLNISLYANSNVDKALENLISASPVTADARKMDYEKLDKAVWDDTPAIMLYSPQYVYVTPARGSIDEVSALESPSDRLYHIQNAYVSTTRLWPIFDRFSSYL